MNEEGKLFGLYEGVVINRNDPEGLCRCKVAIPGIFDPQTENDGPWCRPRGCGSKNWGTNEAPPKGADVYIQFVNGNPEHPVWELAFPGKPNGESEVFPEYEDPDVQVFGRGAFRIVLDQREGQKRALLKVVKTIGNQEQDIVWLEVNYEDNSAKLFAESALGLEAGAIVDINSPGSVQVRGRKVTPSNKPIN